MQLLVLLFFFGLSAGTVAKLRGNPFVIWFLIGFCLPFVGTVAALVARSDADEPRRRCEDCGKLVALHDQVCMRCGAELSFPEAGLGASLGPQRTA